MLKVEVKDENDSVLTIDLSDDFVKYVNSIKDPQPAEFWSQDESTPK